jgi:LuxR family maltose regulon positive regulatory protein
MAGPLLETKLQVPRRRRDLVARPRLSERLSRGAVSELTLVSAPAGFGKTTLLAEWLAGPAFGGRAAAWLSLDQRDNDPALFWIYVVTALNTTYGVGADAITLLQSPQSIEAVIASLLNDLQGVSNDVVLVLDDYHVIDARGIQDGMAFLLEHLPQHVHVVIAGRADPPLSQASPVMTDTSSTTWPRRSCSTSPRVFGTSCCKPQSWTG